MRPFTDLHVFDDGVDEFLLLGERHGVEPGAAESVHARSFNICRVELLISRPRPGSEKAAKDSLCVLPVMAAGS